MKKEIADFCQESVDAYREMLEGIDWMSDETKKAAINKLDHIKIHSLHLRIELQFGKIKS